jgi:hypothetical protein
LLNLTDTTSQLQLNNTKPIKLPAIQAPDLENVDKALKDMNAKFDEARRIIKKHTENLKEASVDIKPILTEAFSGIAEAIGNAIGGGGLQALFGGILKVITGFIKNLGESLIAAGTAMLALKALKLNPITSIVAGIAAVAISTALEAKINASIPRFAEGGMAIGPQLAIVGDNPGGREAIIPSEDFDKFGGGGYIAETRIAGADLVISFKKALAEENRIR